MTMMRNKSPQARREHRSRWKDALKPIMEMFNCTSKEASGHISRLLQDKEKLIEEVATLKDNLAAMTKVAEKQLELNLASRVSAELQD